MPIIFDQFDVPQVPCFVVSLQLSVDLGILIPVPLVCFDFVFGQAAIFVKSLDLFNVFKLKFFTILFDLLEFVFFACGPCGQAFCADVLAGPL